MLPIETIANRLGRAKKTNKGFVCDCPRHKTDEPPLHIGLHKNGSTLYLCCMAGCTYEQVHEALYIKGLIGLDPEEEESIEEDLPPVEQYQPPEQPTPNGHAPVNGAVNGITYSKINTKDFLARPIPPREHIIGPFVKQGLNMVYAPPGVGKTYFAMSLGFAISTAGKFLNWICEQKQSVIYFDGELPAFLLQDRLKALFAQNGISPVTDIDFHIVTPDLQQNPMPDLSTETGQNYALKLIGESQFIIIDNISTLCRTGKENESESWIPVQNWLLKLRTMGKSVLLVHHSGKGEVISPRGTSKREDVLDLVISLAHPKDYQAKDGCKFEMKFRKSRHFRNQADVREVVASFNNRGWEIQGLEESLIDKVRGMYLIDQMTQKQIATELKITKGYVSQIIKRLEAEKEDLAFESLMKNPNI